MAAAHLLLISSREEDVRFGQFLAFANDIQFHHEVTGKGIKDVLVDHPQVVVFWDAEKAPSANVVGKLLAEFAKPSKVFAITDGPLNTYEHLLALPVFGHHVFRRWKDPAPMILSKLVGAVLQPHPFGLTRYFPEGTGSQTIKIVRSGQKTAAVEAINNVCKKKKITSRLSSLVAQAVDEMIMNAVFDAPVLPNGTPLRRGTDRGADFELIDKEHVELEIASTDDYLGISVADQFGSLKKEVILRFLGKDYQGEAYVVRNNDPGAGLGLNGIIQQGLSMLFISKPGVRTEVMLFVPRTDNYKAFRSGFRFVSLMAP